MFVDMVGYTALGQKEESLSLALLDATRNLLRPIVGRHRGKEVKTMGDAFLIEFTSALDAVRCGFDIQRVSREFNIALPIEKRIRLRIGVHLGDVVESDGDIFGDAVNVASRIEPLAADGGVCLTQQVYDQVQNKFELNLVSLGKKALKNVSMPIEVYKVQMPWEEKVESKEEPMIFDRRRLAVLPFANISPDPKDEYFADGMTDELISTLSGIQGLSLISRTSVMQYKNTTKRISDIGRELNANKILEGSVRKSDNRVRITVQLIDTSEDRHLWAQTYDRELQDVFSVQSDIGQRIADALKLHLLTNTKERIERTSTQSMEAYTLYLKGRSFMTRSSMNSVAKAIECFDLVIDEDPKYAPAYAALSECYTYVAGEATPAKEAFSKAKEYVLKALQLDDNLAEAHSSRGVLAFQHDWDWSKTESELKRAIELNPSDSTAHGWFGMYLITKGRSYDGIRELEQAESVDPRSAFIRWLFGYASYLARRFDLARQKCREARELDPISLIEDELPGLLYLEESKFDEAISALQDAAKERPRVSRNLGALGYAYAISGSRKEALEVIEKMKHHKAKIPPLSHVDIAMICSGLGQTGEAMKHLEEAYLERDPWLVIMFQHPAFDSMRTDPGFVRVARRLGL
jgi:TolB-like protein/Flp pilus assembly protein TadD